jgi:hypothetical protein
LQEDVQLTSTNGTAIVSHREAEEPFSPWRLLVHFITGTFVFAVVAGLAVGLRLYIDFLTRFGINAFMIWGLRIAEYLLFVVDLLLFIMFIFRTTRRTLKELSKS